jgi:SNF2 family DNA or RNA helicase
MEELERVRKIRRSDTCTYMTNFGILGDIPGYGKSFSIVALLLRDKMLWDISKTHDFFDMNTINSSITMINRSIRKRVRANLILVSSTLIEQWKEYFSYIKDSILKVKEISTLKDMENVDPNEWDVVIVSSTRYNQFMDKMGSIVWKRFIFDEAASTHINAMRKVSAGFTWFITATYQALWSVSGTSGHYLKAFMNYLNRDILKYFVIKNSTEFVQDSFVMPAVHHVTHRCLNPSVLSALSNYIDDETRLMIGAGDIRGAIYRMGGGSTSATNLFEIVATRQKEKLESAMFSLNMWKHRDRSEKEVDFWQKRVNELEKTISELAEKYKTVLSDDCTICYSTINGPVLIPCCQNVFCGSCIFKWLETKKSCPMCRSVVQPKDLVYIRSESNEDEKEEKRPIQEKPLQKQETVRELIKKGVANGKKFLIFSSYDESFYIIRRELDLHRIPFVEMSGTKATRDSKIKKFKEGKVNVVFLNGRFNGAGINLQEATDIILYHEMTPAIRDQVIGRALRIGRSVDLTVHHLKF